MFSFVTNDLQMKKKKKKRDDPNNHFFPISKCSAFSLSSSKCKNRNKGDSSTP